MKIVNVKCLSCNAKINYDIENNCKCDYCHKEYKKDEIKNIKKAYNLYQM